MKGVCRLYQRWRMTQGSRGEGSQSGIVLSPSAIARPSNINPCHRDSFDEGKSRCDRLRRAGKGRGRSLTTNLPMVLLVEIAIYGRMGYNLRDAACIRAIARFPAERANLITATIL